MTFLSSASITLSFFGAKNVAFRTVSTVIRRLPLCVGARPLRAAYHSGYFVWLRRASLLPDIPPSRDATTRQRFLSAADSVLVSPSLFGCFPSSAINGPRGYAKMSASKGGSPVVAIPSRHAE